MPTITLTNFSGRLTRNRMGTLDSGLADFTGTFGIDSFTDPSSLRFLDKPYAIGAGSSGDSVTDIIVAGKARLEGSSTFVYCVGNTGRVYKIQVNNGNTTPDYDNVVLLKQITINSPTFLYGSSLDIISDGSGTGNEKIYIGHDRGVTSLTLNGVTETFIGAISSTQWQDGYPRLSAVANGNIYYTNAYNIATFNISSQTITSYQQLSPAFPQDYVAVDMDVSADGQYMQILLTRGNRPSVTSSPNQGFNTAQDSFLATWNLVDIGYNQFYSFSDFAITQHQQVGNTDYFTGYDSFGGALFNGTQKIETIPNVRMPSPSATFQNGNMLYWVGQDYDSVTGFTSASIYAYGQFDQNTPVGLYRLTRDNCGSSGSITATPWAMPVTNQFAGSSFAFRSRGKIYFSATDGINNYLMAQNLGTPYATGSTNAGYVTQLGSFSKKQVVKEIRVYYDPSVVAYNPQLYLLAPNNSIINNANSTYAVTTTDTVAKITPQASPQYTFQLKIAVPSGSLATFPAIRKIELDYEEYGR